MCTEDFCKNFNVIMICDRTINIRDVQLDVDESKGCCGVVAGCLRG